MREENVHLKDFFNKPNNSVTRERIFFNRLCYDIKIAAARIGVPLTIFEPEVDRDGFDIIIDDADNNRHFQLKTIVKTSTTNFWYINKRILRPNIFAGQKLMLYPADCGLGGGVMLISFDASEGEPSIEYYYTDYFIIFAFYIRMILEKKHMLKQKTRYQWAAEFFMEIKNGNPTDKMKINKKLFLKVKSADCLLAIAGFHSIKRCYLPADRILDMRLERFEADDKGKVLAHVIPEISAAAHHYATEIYDLLNEPELQTFIYS